MRLTKVTSAAVEALEDVKGRDIKVLNVRNMTPQFDTVIIASGDSTRQCKALANRVRERVKEIGGTVRGIEGERTGEWVLVDLGDTVVHIMQPALRQYYNLEELWTPPPRARKPAAPRATNTTSSAGAKSKKSPGGTARSTRTTRTTRTTRAKTTKRTKPA